MQPWIVIVALVVLLCCLCVGALGLLFAFGGPVLNTLGIIRSWLSGIPFA